MSSFIISTIAILWILQILSLGTHANIIDTCPQATSPPPKNVHDLHPSQIEVIASIGDSITAGVAAINADTPNVDEKSFKQYRGLSWLSGADPEATSIFNYVKHYSPDVTGGSHGVRALPICDKTFFCLDGQSVYEQDALNAAIPASISNHMKNQIEYLNGHMGVDSPYAKKWKMINVFLGTNDLSVACTLKYGLFNYERNMRKGLEALRKNFDNVIVNIVGLSHTERIVGLTDRKQPGYRKVYLDGKLDPQDYECFCCREPKLFPTLGKIDISLHVGLFNGVLQRLARDYGRGGHLGSDTFTVVYQPFMVDIDSLPVEALSNIDGYHPNVISYKFFSKFLWKQMFLPKDEKAQAAQYTENFDMYCPTNEDRIRTD
ncbi:hypothetical protein BC941DRAFT_464830 [Chlamydoabsidia padenii]|nr:hypothetical protein BC941DRAFT_464830 [Chlamydoabsidia padenii]